MFLFFETFLILYFLKLILFNLLFILRLNLYYTYEHNYIESSEH